MQTEIEIMDALAEIIEPKSNTDLVSLGIVKKVIIDEKIIKVKLNIDFDFYLSPTAIYIINSIKKKLHSLPDVDRVEVELLSKDWVSQLV